jgi:hypothetical protein
LCGSCGAEKTRVFLRPIAKNEQWILERRINVKFFVKLGKNASDTCAMVSEGYGGEAMKKSNVSEWYKRFKKGHEYVEDDEDSSHHFFRYQLHCLF